MPTGNRTPAIATIRRPATTDASPQPASRPEAVRATERIAALDAVRGVALAGVLLANLLFAFRVPTTITYLGPVTSTRLLDRLAETLVQFAIQGKAITLFSVLFGVGLAIQRERFAREGPPAPWLVRRLAILLGFGLAHLTLLWNGDILTEYAIAGLLVVPLLQAPTRVLAPLATILYAASILFPISPWMPPFPDDAALLRESEEAMRILGDGTYAQIRAYSLHEWRLFSPTYYTAFTATPALMLAGVLSWRAGFWQGTMRSPRMLAIVAGSGLGAGLVLTAMASDEARFTSAMLSYLASSVAPIVMATGWAATILLALDTGAFPRLLAFAASAGRMAFTNYIAQSVIFTTLFYGYGFGLMGDVGAAAALGGGLLLYALQCMASRRWLARYRFGPLEWAWRCLTYGRRQRFRRDPPQPHDSTAAS